MKYTNTICDGCGLSFREDDDIVVCPECGTPQHRECYKKNNCCVNAHRHGDAFEWKSADAPVKTEVLPERKQEEDTLPCPGCGHKNPKDAKVCENCSMKLIVFGMNLAEKGDSFRQKENPENDADNNYGYKPPFTLGEGEGFDYPDAPAPEMREEPSFYSQPEDTYRYNHTQSDRKRVFLSRFIGNNSEKYIRAFDKLESGKSVTFNWAAFFFTPYWFFYRKLHKAGIIFLTVDYVVSMIFAPVYEKFYTAYMNLLATFSEPAATADPEAFSELFYNSFMELYAEYAPRLFMIFAVLLAIKILAGLIAYPLYKKYTEKSLTRISHHPSSQLAMADIARSGGVSFMAPLIVWSALSLFEMIVSSIQNGGAIF